MRGMNGLAMLASFGAVLLSHVVYAYGPWLEWTPLGGVEINDAGLPWRAGFC